MAEQDGDDVSMTKAAISARYLEEQKGLHRNPELRRYRKACVVGVSDGNIGEAIALRLSKDYEEVQAVDIDLMDVTDPGQVLAFFNDHPLYDTLVLANGYAQLDWFENFQPDQIYKVIDNTLTGSILAANAWVKKTVDAQFSKHLVFIGSMAYRNVLNASAVYCAAKAGLAHLVECLGWELTPKGYRVFGVHPSNVEGTPMTEKTIRGIMRYRQVDREAAEAYWGATNLMPRWLNANDVAETVAHLVSGNADYQSGSNIELRAGQR